MDQGGEPGHAPRSDAQQARLRVLVCLVLFCAGWWFCAWRMHPPRALGADAPATEFSATRALERWRGLAGSGVPHPVGSPAHAELRGAIIAALRALGFETEVQETVSAGQGNVVCVVRNVLARLAGSSPGKATLVCAHYDSVAAGPGAGDDGAGSASVLEIARALKSSAPLEHDVILMIDDAEELGLVGAIAFSEQHRWAKDVGCVVNLEARGTSGPCFLFETSEENAALITLASQVLRHASAWSASYEVYQRMPNDTDLTVFKRQGWQGYNLAFIRGLRHYHTPRDAAEHLSADSVQQMGENALALLRGVARGGLDREAEGRAVYADMYDLGMLHWNQRASLPIACGLALAVLFALWTRVRAGRWRMGRVFACLGMGGLGLALAAGLAWCVQAAALYGSSSPWPNAAEPLWMRAAIATSALAGWLALAALPASARASIEERWAGLALLIALAAVVFAICLPAASYVAIVPLILTLLGFSLHEIKRERVPAGAPWMLCGLGLFATLGVAGPLLVALEWVFEFRLCAALGLLAAFVFLPLWPLLADAPKLARALALAALVASIGLVFGARASPAWSAEHPAPLTLNHYQEATGGDAHWYLGTYGEAAPSSFSAFTPKEEAPFSRALTLEHPAPRLALEAPRLERSAGADGAKQLLLASPRAARNLLLRLPQGAKLVGLAVPERKWACNLRNTRGSLLLAGFGAERIRLTYEGDLDGNVELFDVDTLRADEAREWIAKRGDDRVPISTGDLSVQRVTLAR